MLKSWTYNTFCCVRYDSIYIVIYLLFTVLVCLKLMCNFVILFSFRFHSKYVFIRPDKGYTCASTVGALIKITVLYMYTGLAGRLLR